MTGIDERAKSEDRKRASQRKAPRLRTRIAVLASSIIVSLALAETIASLSHRGAFPYLNLFEADSALGVRLRPNAETRVRSRSGRVTRVRTNSLGFRGGEWPSNDSKPSSVRVLLLGDSQMFGYNVDEELALSARIDVGSAGHVTVLNAAVPTWGPPDYVIALRELAPRHRPRFVLFVANAANDWFEPVPNRRRTTAQDGWATRAGTPESQWFPFRGWVMGQSHLVFGIRQIANWVGDAQPQTSQSALRLKADLPMLRKGSQGYRSTITPNLKAAALACAEMGCEVVAVALPSDVQVSPAEWGKYRAMKGSSPADLTDTEALLDDFVADARDLGLQAVNLLAPLRAAEPGAFLDDDYHLSPKGHGAVADTLLPVLRLEEASRGSAP